MHIYLSPHHDDACFSLGHLAGTTDGALINIFTISDYVARRIALPPGREARIALVSEIRRREDIAFAGATGLQRHELGLPEPSVIGIGAFSYEGMREEVLTLAKALVPRIAALVPRDPGAPRTVVHCPMGIGGHRNHVSVMMAMRQAWPLLERRCDLHLYEDLHYASRADLRQRGLEFAGRVFDGFALSPQITQLGVADAEAKLRRIALYASQHEAPPRIEEFTPASGLAVGPHEIEWRVAPPGRADRTTPEACA